MALPAAALTSLRVAITGGGMSGPALALLLKQKLGVRAEVFERDTDIREVGAGALTACSMKLAARQPAHQPSAPVAALAAGPAGCAQPAALPKDAEGHQHLSHMHTQKHCSMPYDANAGISLAPNGVRVLSQLGIREQLVGAGEKISAMCMSRSDGSRIVQFPTKAEEQVRARYRHHLSVAVSRPQDYSTRCC